MMGCTEMDTIRRAQKNHECMFGHMIEEGSRYMETKIMTYDWDETGFYTYRRCLICTVVTPICQGGCGGVVSHASRFCDDCKPEIHGAICKACGWAGRQYELKIGSGPGVYYGNTKCPECNGSDIKHFSEVAKPPHLIEEKNEKK